MTCFARRLSASGAPCADVSDIGRLLKVVPAGILILVFLSVSASGDFSNDYNTAVYFYKRGEFELAAKAVEEMASRYSDDSRLDAALYWGGQSYDRLGKSRDALRLYRRLLENFPQSGYRFDSLTAAGQAASAIGSHQDALSFFRAAAARAESGADGKAMVNIQVKISETLLKTGENEEAERVLLAIVQNPNTPKDRRAEADLRYRQLLGRTGRVSQARAQFSRLPKNSEFYKAEEAMYRGDASFAEGKYGESRSWYEQVYRRSSVPADFRAQAMYNSARASQLVGDADNAFALFRDVVNSRDALPDIRGSAALQLAYLYRNAGQNDAASEMAAVGQDVAQSITNGHLNDDLLYFLGETAFQQKKYQAAYDHLSMMTETGYRVDRLKGLVFVETGRPKDAADLLERASVLAPNDESRNQCYFDLARIHAQSDQMDRAMSELDRIQRPSPALEEQMAPLRAELLYQAGRYKEASQAFGRLATDRMEGVSRAPGMAQERPDTLRAGSATAARHFRYLSALASFKDKNLSWAEKLMEKLSAVGGIPEGSADPAAFLDAAMQIDRAIEFSAAGKEESLARQIDPFLDRVPDMALLAFVIESLYAKDAHQILPKYARRYTRLAGPADRLIGRSAYYEMVAHDKNGDPRSAQEALGELSRWLERAAPLSSDLAEEAEFWKPKLAQAVGDQEGAKEGYRSYIKKYPKGKYASQAYVQFGNFSLASGSPEEAEVAFEQLMAKKTPTDIAADPILSKASYDLAVIRSRQRRFADALELLEPLAAVGYYKDNPDYQFLLASTYQSLGKPSNARTHFRIVAEMSGAPASLIDQSIDAILTSLFRGRQFSELDGDFRRYSTKIKDKAVLSRAKYYMGMMHFQAGRYSEAASYFDGVQVPAGSDPVIEAAVRRADCEYHLGRYSSALDLYNKVIRAHPDSPWAENSFYLLELCKIKLGQSGDALSGYENFLKQSPDAPQAPEVAFEVAKLYLQAEDMDATDRMLDFVEKRRTEPGPLLEEVTRMRLDIGKRRGQNDKIIQLAKVYRSVYGMNVGVALEAAVAATKTGALYDAFDLGSRTDLAAVSKVFEDGFSTPKSRAVVYAIDEKFYDRGSRSGDAENTVKCSLKRLVLTKGRVFLIVESRGVGFVSDLASVRIRNVYFANEELKRIKDSFMTGVQMGQEFGIAHGQTKVFVISIPRENWSDDMQVGLDVDFAGRKLLLTSRVKAKTE